MLLDITWNVNPEIFSIGTFSVRWYGLLFALGFLVGQQIMTKVYKTEHMPEKDLDSLMLTMVLSTVIGARVGHYVFYEWEGFLADPLHWLVEMILPPYSGLASHGATIGILSGLAFYAIRKKQYFLWVVDRIVITVALGGCFIRLGNLMNSEIVGKPADVPWAFRFMRNTEYLPVVPRHPAQLYEAITCLILCFLLYGIWKKYKEATPHGLLLGIFLIWIFGLRFLYEFLKENQEGFESTMSFNMGQILSVPAILLGIYFLWFALSKKRTGAYINKPQTEEQEA
ncbi:MAG: prolipoprotein diacylglyceryl transferase [Spirosomataceae bacterium]